MDQSAVHGGEIKAENSEKENLTPPMNQCIIEEDILLIHHLTVMTY